MNQNCAKWPAVRHAVTKIASYPTPFSNKEADRKPFDYMMCKQNENKKQDIKYFSDK